MGERTRTRVQAVRRAFAARAHPAPAGPRERILVAHNLLLGDTLMLAPLFAKLAHEEPEAELLTLAAPALVPLFAGRPYGVRALPFRPSDRASIDALWREAPVDRAVVVGDNRYSWIAAAMGARHVVAHAGDRPFTKQWMVDEQRPYSSEPRTWGDMVADLVDGPEPRPYARGDWPAPPHVPFERPAGRYAVLHVGASSPLKYWPAARWAALAHALEADGLEVAWSAGRGEEALVAACDPEGRRRSYAGRLDLAQLWHLLEGAAALVAPDTGVAHLARLAWTPTVAIFGPGSAPLVGRGHFFRDAPWHAAVAEPFPCRDQDLLFRRHVAWVRRCGRSTAQCDTPRCMQAVSLEEVLAAARRIMKTS